MKPTFEHVDCKHCNTRFQSVFCKSENDIVAEIDAEKICSTFKKGETIFKEGSYASGVYCINAGKIKISMLGDEGKEQIVRLAKPGDIIGYKALLSGDRYSATATTLEDCNVCFIPRDIFMKILQKDAAMSFEMMKILSNELRNAEEKITHLAQKPVRERVAETILFLKETYGIDAESNINIALTREEIANLVGTATETTIRLLSEFNKEKIIELSGKKIKIVNLPKLIKTANIYD
ncbi:MAG TPA: Crp/Fnr family transcriptional regulator [Chitinophagales bacterium]|jgi:CRP-like cAMP-binding protein|nr:Crp/Fnr family transcriptional regulator [Chitinophagales bacterium]MBP6153477.1 Crp/Fnr family transcriptional regulator [Chitinophagales bacterium]HQV78096.1 Crp/Fnr family transcriptional regulator [Chitinophagales bacterium]HQW80103.1 Crp/Fnr family transcriptional regulator [Chitinophagales bacterium]HRB19310.1 Crp/Fnr family transcriptional regulator [Chitinophagales bacterium]